MQRCDKRNNGAAVMLQGLKPRTRTEVNTRDITGQPYLILNVTESQRFDHASSYAHLDLLDVHDDIESLLDNESLFVGQSINQVVVRLCAWHE